jgi:hypothetical protein
MGGGELPDIYRDPFPKQSFIFPHPPSGNDYRDAIFYSMLNIECNDWEEDKGVAKCPYFTDVPTFLVGKMCFPFLLRFVTHPPISSYATIRG